MPIIHLHSFEETERFYSEPFSGANLKVSRANAETIARIFKESTTILYRCKICGEPRTERVLGLPKG